MALDHFLKLGYVLLDQNYRTRLGEIDLVFQKGEQVIFVEVKLREGRQVVDPRESVTKSKQRRVIKAALQFIKQRRLKNKCFRFDVAIVREQGLEHIENAFSGSRHYTF